MGSGWGEDYKKEGLKGRKDERNENKRKKKKI